MNKTKSLTIMAAIALLALAIGMTPGTSEAGKPRYKSASEETTFQKPVVVDNSTTAFSYYAELAPGKPDVYQVYANAGEAVHISMAAPQLDYLKSFTPTLALIGPGLVSTVDTKTLPITPPKGMEAIALDYKGDIGSRAATSDGATMTSYWQGQEYSGTYPQSGPYYILVWDKQGRGGKYIMSVGAQDEFGLFDLIKFPYTWLKLNLWYGNWLGIIVALVVLAAIIAGIVWLVRAQRKRSRPGNMGLGT